MNPTAAPVLQAVSWLGWPLLLAVVWGSVRAVRQNDLSPAAGWRWWVLVAAALLCFRWPLLWVPRQLNPDESQLIAGAITLRHDPVFWRSVDGDTAGPVDFFPLLPAAWADGTASYAAARAIALAAVFGTLFFAGEAIALLAGAAVARLVILPGLAFYAFTTNPDFTHCSTEIMPMLLLAAAGWLATRHGTAPSRMRLWGVALLLGTVPWAKLQAAPFAVVLWILIGWREFAARRPRMLAPLVFGALLPTLVIAGLVTMTGQMEHMIASFVLNNIAYVRAPQFTWLDTIRAQWQNTLLDGYLGFWFAGAALFSIWMLVRRRRAPAASRRREAVAALLLAAGFFCALAPRRPSAHHLHLVVLPALWWLGTMLAAAWEDATPERPAKRWLAAGVLLALCLVPQMFLRASHVDPFAGINRAEQGAARRELAALVRQVSAPGEPLAIWGSRCSLYVEAHRPQATRQAQSGGQIFPGPLQRYFLQRYFDDFRAANPPVFVDAVGPGNFVFDDRRQAHEAFPLLRTWIAGHYTLAAELDGTRVFVRNDRWALSLAPR